MNPKYVFAGVLVLVLGGGAVYKYLHRAADEATPAASIEQPAAEPAATPEAPAQPAIRNQVPSNTDDKPLPSLDDSDAGMQALIVKLIGSSGYMRWVRPEQLIRRIVADVDGLGRPNLGVERRVIRPVGGELKVIGDESAATLSPDNAIRYQPLIQLLRVMDLKSVASEYTRNYPLFQQAYRDLGYPNGYFNDRLVDVIDQMLATPEPQGPVQLVRPNVMYRYADPDLEALTSGQKLLLRMGSENETLVKARLRELRPLIATQKPAAP